MKHSAQRLMAACSGVTTLEFAFVGPIVISLVVGIPVTGLMLWTKAAMQLAASHTARCKAINSPSCADHHAYASSIISEWGVSRVVPSINVSVIENSCNRASSGLFKSVTVTATGNSGLPFFAPFSSVVLTANACYPLTLQSPAPA